ncbi:MAG: ABC transporter permease [Candidatus Lustribacter sp.]|jgi:ABC-type nitrate/sulfonate/bicarbonate transport system permease component
MKAKQHGIQFGVLVAVLAAWYLLTLPGRINPILLPPPVPVVAAFGALLTTPGLWSDVFVTVCEWLVAFVLGALAGCVAGYLVSLTPYTVRVFDPLIAGFYSIPAILLFPLYLLFFGLGPASKIAIGMTIAFFPVALNTIAGLGSVDRSFIRAARSMGASRLQLFGTVMLPAALPVVLSGLRLGGIVAFMTILGCEMISSLSGLGHRIVELAENMEPVRMFANILVAVLLAFAINLGVSYAEARGKRWAR